MDVPIYMCQPVHVLLLYIHSDALDEEEYRAGRRDMVEDDFASRARKAAAVAREQIFEWMFKEREKRKMASTEKLAREPESLAIDSVMIDGAFYGDTSPSLRTDCEREVEADLAAKTSDGLVMRTAWVNPSLLFATKDDSVPLRFYKDIGVRGWPDFMFVPDRRSVEEALREALDSAAGEAARDLSCMTVTPMATVRGVVDQLASQGWVESISPVFVPVHLPDGDALAVTLMCRQHPSSWYWNLHPRHVHDRMQWLTQDNSNVWNCKASEKAEDYEGVRYEDNPGTFLVRRANGRQWRPFFQARELYREEIERRKKLSPKQLEAARREDAEPTRLARSEKPDNFMVMNSIHDNEEPEERILNPFIDKVTFSDQRFWRRPDGEVPHHEEPGILREEKKLLQFDEDADTFYDNMPVYMFDEEFVYPESPSAMLDVDLLDFNDEYRDHKLQPPSGLIPPHISRGSVRGGPRADEGMPWSTVMPIENNENSECAQWRAIKPDNYQMNMTDYDIHYANRESKTQELNTRYSRAAGHPLRGFNPDADELFRSFYPYASDRNTKYSLTVEAFKELERENQPPWYLRDVRVKKATAAAESPSPAS